MKDPVKHNNINHSVVKMWTKAELAETKKQAKAGGFEVSKIGFNGIVTIVDTENGALILKAACGPNNLMLVRLDGSYFEPTI